MSQFNKVAFANLEESIIAALSQLAPDTKLSIAGKVVASEDLRAQLQAHRNMTKAANEARAKFSQLVALDQSERAAMAPVVAALRSYAAVFYGEASTEFAAFGFKPRKVGQRTVEVKAIAVEKLRATRAARHTMGKRQRAAIHGVVPPKPASTPVVSPPPAPTATKNGVSH